MALAPETYGCADADADGSPSSPHGDSEALLLNMKGPEADKADTNADTQGDLKQAEPATLPQDATAASEEPAGESAEADWQRSKMACKLVVKMLFMVLPHMLFVYTVSNVKAEYLQACNDEAGCVYKRLFASATVASTDGYFASVRNGEPNIVTLSPNTHDHQQANFTFTSVSLSSDVAEQREHLQMIWQIGDLWVRLFQHAEMQHAAQVQQPALCDNMTLVEMQETCNSEAMKMGFQNHLLGAGMYTSLVFTCWWGAFTLLHDLLVLWNFQPQCSLFVGYVSLLLQSLAGISGMFWASGCAQVFASPHPDGNCSCFYQMPLFEAVAAMISPALLLKGAVDQFLLWVNTAIYGDCLYLQVHKIPHHIERASSSWQEGHLMIWPLGPLSNGSQPQRLGANGFACILLGACSLVGVMMYVSLVSASAVVGSISKLRTFTAGIWLLDFLMRLVPAVIYLLESCLLSFAWYFIIVVGLIIWKIQKEPPQDKWFFGFAVLVICCYVFLTFFFGRTVELFWPPQWLQDLPMRERSVLESELMSEGLNRVVAGALFFLSAPFSRSANVIGTLSGTHHMSSAKRFLAFAKAHKDLIWSFPDLKKLLQEAEEDPEMEESEWLKKVEEIWGRSSMALMVQRMSIFMPQTKERGTCSTRDTE